MSVAKLAEVKMQIDIAEAISELSLADKARLMKVANIYSGAARMLPDDLLQESFSKALEEKRKCPADLNVVVFLCGTIKSLASNEVERRKRRLKAEALETTTEHYDLLTSAAPDPTISVEESIIEQEAEKVFYDRLSEEFENDEEGYLVLLGMFEGLRGGKLCEAAGVTATELATIRKRIKRKLSQLKNGNT